MENQFQNTLLEFDNNLFSVLSGEIEFETIGKGRLGNHLVKPNGLKIPLVRTTSKFSIAPCRFSSTHQRITDSILKVFPEIGNTVDFNNALIEIYDSSYKKMKYHSDHSLDLHSDSYIALFSCYQNPENLESHHIRKLKIKDKETENEFEIPLQHNSIVLFSTKTNNLFYHKIVLESNQKPIQNENKWLGITFRTSKTFIEFKNKIPFFENNQSLKMATEEEQKEFYQLRGKENRSNNFQYPEINYTLSKADLLTPNLIDC